MTFRRCILLLLLTLACLTDVCADGAYIFRSYMTSGGLSDNSVLCGLRDRYGFMWFGTSNGLTYFDGRVSVAYRNFAFNGAGGSAGSDIVTALMECGDDIYVGNSNGIAVLRRATGRLEPFKATTRYGVVVSSLVQKMVRARGDGLVWIGTRGQGLFVYNPKSGQLEQNSRRGGFVCDIALMAGGNVAVAMLDGSINVYSPHGRFLYSNRIEGYVSDKNHICLYADGNRLWVGTDVGLYLVEGRRGVTASYRPPFYVGAIGSIDGYGPGQLVVGTRRGVYKFGIADRQFARFDDEVQMQGLVDKDVNGVLTDRFGTLWVLTSHGGVSYLPRNEVMFRFNTLSGSADGGLSLVNAFASAGGGDMWVGTNNGLYLYSQATTSVAPYRGGLVSCAVRTLMVDGRRLWIGTAMDGLKILDTATGAVSSYSYSSSAPYSLPGNQVNAICKTQRGVAYVATNWGLCRFNEATGRFVTFPQVPSATEFTDVCTDHSGNVWAATSGIGLFHLDSKTGGWRQYVYDKNNPHSLPVNTVTSVKCDSRGRLWVATRGGGLCRYDEATHGFYRCNGVDDNVNFVSEDRKHNLWAASDNSLYKIGGGSDPVAVRVSSPQEMSRRLLVQRAVGYSSADVMFIGNADGFYTFRPLLVKGADTAPVYVTAITLPYASDPNAEADRLGLNGSLVVCNRVELPYRDNSFTLHFASPRFASAQGVLYDYMLKGVDKQWVRRTSNIEATYSNLSPGDYEFLLRESGVEGNVARVYIRVLPPWYLTWWALVSYVLLVAGLVYVGGRIARSKVRRRYDQKLEQYRAEEEKRTFESKINFFVNLVHEIRTPLSLIVLPLEQLSKRKHDEVDSKCISVMGKNVNYLLSMANQLLDFQKAESGKYELHRADLSVAAYMRDVYEQFAPYCEVEGKTMRMELPDDDIVTAIDRDLVGKIMMNLMSNALKYTRTEIVLRVARGAEGDVCLSVSDDGPGIADSDKLHIFDSFYQVSNDRVAQTMGTGLGLAFAKTLAVTHGGDLRVDDVPTGGSCFTLTLPLLTVGTAESDGRQAQPVMMGSGAGVEAGADLKSYTVLLVEDNRQLLEMTADALGAWYRVLTAKNGAEALTLMSGNDIDVVVSDVMMPVMDGIALCSRIKGDINFSHIPVILLTAKITVEAKVAGMKSGADVYLEKPFAIEQLHMQIENLFRLRQNFHKRMGAAEGGVDVAVASELGVNQQDMAFLERVQEVFEANVADESFSIDMLAGAMNMSRSSFYRKLKALTGMTPVDFMRSRRIRRGAELLLSGRSVSEVAALVGFSSSSYFTKCFKMELGVLPKDYVESRGKE